MLFQQQSTGAWALSGKLDQGKAGKIGSTSAAGSAMAKFRQMDSRAQAETEASGSGLDTVHENTITCVRGVGDGKGFSTTGVDGRLVIWDAVACGMGNMRI